MQPIYAAKVYLQVKEADGQWVDIIWDDGDAWSDYSGNFEIRRHPAVARELPGRRVEGQPLARGGRRVRARQDRRRADAVARGRDQRLVRPRSERVPGATSRSRCAASSCRSETQEELTIWHPKEDGTFRLSPLKRGKYSVRVTCDSGRDILLDVEPVAVRDGETSRIRGCRRSTSRSACGA